MIVRPSDFNSDGDKNKTVGKAHLEAQSEAESAMQRMFSVVDLDRKAAKTKPDGSLHAENSSAKFEASPSSVEGSSFLSQRPINYYEGKLSPGAGSTAETGLKGLFNIDRLNTMLSPKSELPSPHSATRVDGLTAKKDSLTSSFEVPDFVPKFPSA